MGSACDIQDDARFGIEEQCGRGTRREMKINMESVEPVYLKR